jgi:cytochrome b561
MECRPPLFHWLTVAILIWELSIAFFAMGPGIATMVWLPTHLSLGLGLLLLVIIRLVWRGFERTPVRRHGALSKIGGSLIQLALYGLLLSVIVTGWIVYRPMPLMPPVKIIGLLPLPKFPGLASLPAWPYPFIHRVLTWIFVGLIALHIGAALVHGWRRDGVLSGMTFRRSG